MYIAYCIWRVIFPIPILNRLPRRALRLFCHVPLKRDQSDWDWRIWLNETPRATDCTIWLTNCAIWLTNLRLEDLIEWDSTCNRLYHMTHELCHMTHELEIGGFDWMRVHVQQTVEQMFNNVRMYNKSGYTIWLTNCAIWLTNLRCSTTLGCIINQHYEVYWVKVHFNLSIRWKTKCTMCDSYMYHVQYVGSLYVPCTTRKRAL